MVRVSLSGPAEVEKEVNFQVNTDFNICANTFVETRALLLGSKCTASFSTRNMDVV